MKIVEFAGVGPAPFCAMLLADLGADIIRIDCIGVEQNYDSNGISFRGRRSVALDLRQENAVQACLKLTDQADAVIEGFRPGVMERLGLGPEVLLQRNPALVYGRMTGWGQTGPLAQTPGHDINFIALSGALHAIGNQNEPVIPLNLVADYGGGALYLAMGLLAAIIHTRNTGEGQVIDCAMLDGVVSLLGVFYGNLAAGSWQNQRQRNVIDGGSHFYNVYQCKDGKWLAVGAIEPKFYTMLLEQCGITDPDFSEQYNPQRWPALKTKLSAIFREKDRDEWCQLMQGTDVCITPVLDFADAPAHRHNQVRGNFVDINGVTQPAPMPKFSKTPGAIQHASVKYGEHDEQVLEEWGMSREDIRLLKETGAM